MRKSLPSSLILIYAVMIANPAGAIAVTNTRVSVASDGSQTGPRSQSLDPSLARRGRLVAFSSNATNLVAGDTNRRYDVFVQDTLTGQTIRVSVASNGAQSRGGGSFEPSLSPGGRYVAFTSAATNLVPGDTNGQLDVFVYDLATDQTKRVSIATNGTQASAAGSLSPTISRSGSVAFESGAPNLVPHDTNDRADVFVHDQASGKTMLVSLASDGTPAGPGGFGSHNPAISRNGRVVSFSSTAGNLVAHDTNKTSDVFVHDLKTGTTTRVSVASDGAQTQDEGGCCSDTAISGHGQFVAFDSTAPDLVAGDTNGLADVFVHDRNSGVTRRVSESTLGAEAMGAGSFQPSISPHGRFVAFDSRATGLVVGDSNHLSDIFIRDLRHGSTERVSVAPNGAEANGSSFSAAISGGGKIVTYESDASNLVPDDTNGKPLCHGDEARIPCADVFETLID